MKDRVRIANGQGFWGDSIDAPLQLVESGNIDYLTLDYLAEVTMSILRRQMMRDNDMGYAHDFVALMAKILPQLEEKGINVLANASGVNPLGCLKALREVVKDSSLDSVKVGIVEGDDILPNLSEFVQRGHLFKNIDTGEPLGDKLKDVTVANAYISAFPMAEALGGDARIVLTGRVVDPALTLAPLIHEFGWGKADFDLLASGTVAGHIIECGAQATGGNFSRWWEVENYRSIGYPVAVVQNGGDFVITKPIGTGGVVNRASVTEQILYELGDPTAYLSPDVTVDFTSFSLAESGEDCVAVSGVKGAPPPDHYKVSMAFHGGYKATGQLTVSGPKAIEKGEAVANIIWSRLEQAGCNYKENRTELVGAGALFGNGIDNDPSELTLRLSVRDSDKAKVARFGKEIAPVVTNGPPGITGFSGGRPKPQEVLAYWPTTVPKEWLDVTVRVEEI
ncbi:MAG: ATPase [Candidatus Marinimicrobia bacterium]|nr:ATPase [Candidatus Neomarinimicrobiota bacterium]